MARSMGAVSGGETIKTLAEAIGLPSFTVDELAQRTGVSPRTVATVRRRYAQVFERLPSAGHARGRPPVCWRLRPEKVDEVVRAIESHQAELQSALGAKWRAAVADTPATDLAESSLIMAADALMHPAESAEEAGQLVAAARHSLVAAGFDPDGTPWSNQLDSKHVTMAGLIAAAADLIDAHMMNDRERVETAQERVLLRIGDAASCMAASEWLPLAQRILNLNKEIDNFHSEVNPVSASDNAEAETQEALMHGGAAEWSALGLASIEKRDILFENIARNEKLSILKEYFSRVLQVPKGERVPVEQGLSYIQKGIVSVYVTITATRGKTSRKVRLADLGVGQFFGETVALVPDRQHSADLVAARECRVRALREPNSVDEYSQTDVFRNLVGKYPQIGINLGAELSRRLRRTNRLVPTHPRGRVALLLLETANEEDPTATIPRLQNMTPKAIVDAAGVSRDAVINALRKFEEEQVVQREGDAITIIDRNKLAQEILINS
jgi:CRP-like cAMP-binding protein